MEPTPSYSGVFLCGSPLWVFFNTDSSLVWDFLDAYSFFPPIPWTLNEMYSRSALRRAGFCCNTIYLQGWCACAPESMQACASTREYVHACIYHVYLKSHTYTDTRPWACARTHTQTHTHTHTYTHTHTHTHTHAHTHTHTYSHTHIHTHTHTQPHTNMHM